VAGTLAVPCVSPGWRPSTADLDQDFHVVLASQEPLEPVLQHGDHKRHGELPLYTRTRAIAGSPPVRRAAPRHTARSELRSGPRPGFLHCSLRWPRFRRSEVAEADGNRTRQGARRPLVGFEVRGRSCCLVLSGGSSCCPVQVYGPLSPRLVLEPTEIVYISGPPRGGRIRDPEGARPTSGAPSGDHPPRPGDPASRDKSCRVRRLYCRTVTEEDL
jgi:hypothetical protein